MSQLIFAQAKSILRKAEKQTQRLIDANIITENDREETINTYINVDRKEFKRILSVAKLLHDDYIDVMKQDTKNWYFITIRPDNKKITFIDFYNKCKTFAHRAFITEYSLSFEQKGTNDVSLGHGFHAHIVCKTSARSKGEVLRYTQSTFSTCTADNCIEVIPTRMPEDIINNYLLNYESKDGHKIVTKEWDALWRAQNNLKNLYNTKEDWTYTPVSIKSVETGNDICTLTF